MGRPTIIRRVFVTPQGAAGLVIVSLVLFLAIFADVIAPHDPVLTDLPRRFQGASAEHWLGTDESGRDIWSRIVYGSRITLLCATTALVIGLLFGVPLGVLAGAGTKKMDLVLSGIMDVLLAFPGLLLAMAVVAVLEPNLKNAMIAIGIVYIPRFGRLVRAQVLSERQKEYVLAAQSLCIAPASLWFRHVLLNCMTPLIVAATLSLATAILEAASLSFLGLGVQPPTPEWGAMLNSGRQHILSYPELTYIPGIAIMLTVLGINLVGDALRDVIGKPPR